jgi:hypothetical protein
MGRMSPVRGMSVGKVKGLPICGAEGKPRLIALFEAPVDETFLTRVAARHQAAD